MIERSGSAGIIRTFLTANGLFTLATSLIPDPAFGLGAATCWHPSNLGPLGYAWLSSGSLRTALHRLDRYSQVLGSQYRDDCVDEAGGCATSSGMAGATRPSGR